MRVTCSSVETTSSRSSVRTLKIKSKVRGLCQGVACDLGLPLSRWQHYFLFPFTGHSNEEHNSRFLQHIHIFLSFPKILNPFSINSIHSLQVQQACFSGSCAFLLRREHCHSSSDVFCEIYATTQHHSLLWCERGRLTKRSTSWIGVW